MAEQLCMSVDGVPLPTFCSSTAPKQSQEFASSPHCSVKATERLSTPPAWQISSRCLRALYMDREVFLLIPLLTAAWPFEITDNAVVHPSVGGLESVKAPLSVRRWYTCTRTDPKSRTPNQAPPFSSPVHDSAWCGLIIVAFITLSVL